jgi:polyhydroxybutyrate depolymerase
VTGSGTYTMSNQNIDRTFRVHVPGGDAPGEGWPLAVIFHGWGGNENEFLGNRSVTTLANKRGYVLVAPRGLGSNEGEPNSWTFSGSDTGQDVAGSAICDASITPDYRYPSCSAIAQNTCSWTHCQADDVAFAIALVGEIKSCLHVDADNVFATGGSNGGMFAWELGQDSTSAGTFRAIAPLIGLPHRGYLRPQGKPDSADMPVLVITGTRDSVVPPGDWEDNSFTTTSNGSDRFYYTGATAITRVWAKAHGCDTAKVAKGFDDGNRQTDCRSYCAASGGEWPKVLDCRASMGHSYSLSWSWKLILDFFDAHKVRE